MKRRNFIKGIAGLAFTTGLYSWQIEPHWLEFVKLKMPVKNLPPCLLGKTLMQISDIHVGKVDMDYLVKSLKEAAKLQPDFVAYTGDYVSLKNDRILYEDLKKLMQYFVRGKMGTVAILGNHDYGKDWAKPEVADNITKILQDANITVLRNAQAAFNGLNFIGFDDSWGTNFFPGKVMSNYDASLANVLLCHNPDVCDMDVWNGYTGWILAGHTHGGQCKPPFLPPPILPVSNSKYSSGKIDLEDGRMLYINRALGHMLQVRFNVRPEITVFELTAD